MPLLLVRLSGGAVPAPYSRRCEPNTSSIMCSLASMPQSITTSSLLRCIPSVCLFQHQTARQKETQRGLAVVLHDVVLCEHRQ